MTSNDQRYSEASAMVLAASDLLRVACDSNTVSVSKSLDNNTLKNIAEAVYREVQVAEMLFIQLSEMYEQARQEQVLLHTEHPQISIPVSMLTLPQLQNLIGAGELRIESYASKTMDISEQSRLAAVKQIQNSIAEIKSEISRRES